MVNIVSFADDQVDLLTVHRVAAPILDTVGIAGTVRTSLAIRLTRRHLATRARLHLATRARLHITKRRTKRQQHTTQALQVLQVTIQALQVTTVNPITLHHPGPTTRTLTTATRTCLLPSLLCTAMATTIKMTLNPTSASRPTNPALKLTKLGKDPRLVVSSDL